MIGEDIKILLTAFYNGETTVEEEQQLLSYFESNYVDEELLDDKHLFLELYNHQPIDIPDNLETKLERLVESLEKEEARVKNNREIKKTKRKLAIILTSAASIAACITFIVFLYSANNSNRIDTNLAEYNVNYIGNYELRDTYTNPADAQKIADEALIKVSTQLNRGLNQLNFATTNYERKIEKINN